MFNKAIKQTENVNTIRLTLSEIPDKMRAWETFVSPDCIRLQPAPIRANFDLRKAKRGTSSIHRDANKQCRNQYLMKLQSPLNYSPVKWGGATQQRGVIAETKN